MELRDLGSRDGNRGSEGPAAPGPVPGVAPLRAWCVPAQARRQRRAPCGSAGSGHRAGPWTPAAGHLQSGSCAGPSGQEGKPPGRTEGHGLEQPRGPSWKELEGKTVRDAARPSCSFQFPVHAQMDPCSEVPGQLFAGWDSWAGAARPSRPRRPPTTGQRQPRWGRAGHGHSSRLGAARGTPSLLRDGPSGEEERWKHMVINLGSVFIGVSISDSQFGKGLFHAFQATSVRMINANV